jgi:hypothetical protein
MKQASIQQFPAESYRARVWEMHLRGIPKTQIAAAVGINRETVARIVRKCYAEIASDQKFSPARTLGEAVARMRLVQEQAWADHDADDGQRWRYLRIILDVEREIARLEGLYEVGMGVESEVVFSIRKRE